MLKFDVNFAVYMLSFSDENACRVELSFQRRPHRTPDINMGRKTMCMYIYIFIHSLRCFSFRFPLYSQHIFHTGNQGWAFSH